MYHYIYLTTDDEGNYYFGRHSTSNLNDGYKGSGNWVSEMEDDSHLKNRIVETIDLVDDLDDERIKIVLDNSEERFLKFHFKMPGCKNETPKSRGWGSGSANPMNNPLVAAKISGDNHYMRKDADAREASRQRQNKLVLSGKHFFQSDDHPNKDGSCVRKAIENGTHINLGENNPSKTRSKNGTHQMFRREDGSSIGGDANKKRISAGTHNFQGPETNQARIDNETHNFLGPKSNLDRLADGTHPSQTLVSCICCRWEVSVGMFKRWHDSKNGVPQCHLDPRSPRYNPDLKPR